MMFDAGRRWRMGYGDDGGCCPKEGAVIIFT